MDFYTGKLEVRHLGEARPPHPMTVMKKKRKSGAFHETFKAGARVESLDTQNVIKGGRGKEKERPKKFTTPWGISLMEGSTKALGSRRKQSVQRNAGGATL